MLLKRKVEYLLDFMYDPPVGQTITSQPISIEFSKTNKRIKGIYNENKLTAIQRQDGYILLEKHGLVLLSRANVKLSKAVVIKDLAKPFVINGKDVFAKHIKNFVGDHYLGEDVIVVSDDGKPIACGQLLLLPTEVKFFKRGVAVKIRVGLEGDVDEA
jgi:archaeosine-15-forming tRNA-guanine transglycosylase